MPSDPHARPSSRVLLTTRRSAASVMTATSLLQRTLRAVPDRSPVELRLPRLDAFGSEEQRLVQSSRSLDVPDCEWLLPIKMPSDKVISEASSALASSVASGTRMYCGNAAVEMVGAFDGLAYREYPSHRSKLRESARSSSASHRVTADTHTRRVEGSRSRRVIESLPPAPVALPQLYTYM